VSAVWARRLHRGHEVVDVVRGGQAGLCRGGSPRRLQVRVNDLGGGEDGDVLAADGGRVWSERLCRVLADPENGVARLRPGREGHLQPGRPAVLAVIVGLGDQRHAGALERSDGGGRRREDELLGLRLGAGAVGQSGLEVHHGEIDAREEGGHRRTQGVGGVSRQPIAQGGPGREVDVPAEGEGDALPVPLPVRIESGVRRWRRWRLVVVARPIVVPAGRRGSPATPAEAQGEREGGGQHDELAGPEAPVALDPARGKPGGSAGGTGGPSAPGRGRVRRSVGDVRTL
jgi:hypothetical protein